MVWIVQENEYEMSTVVGVFESMGDAFALASELFIKSRGMDYNVFEMDVAGRDPDNDGLTGITKYEDLPPGPKSRVAAFLQQQHQYAQQHRQYEQQQQQQKQAARDACIADLKATRPQVFKDLVAVQKKLEALDADLVGLAIPLTDYRLAHAVLDIERSVLREAVYDFVKMRHTDVCAFTVYDEIMSM